MNKPSDFMLGLLDFFAVLLPGAMATWLVTRYEWLLPASLLQHLTTAGQGQQASIVSGAVFLLTSYALGNFVFMLGSRLDETYDGWRRRTKPVENDAVYNAAVALRLELTPQLAGDGFSTFKWARTYVGVHNPQTRGEIDRLEATSKFFRGLVVVLVALALHFLLRQSDVVRATAALVIAVLSFVRFCDQRWKMTELTYASAVIVHETKAKPSAEAAEGGHEGEHEE